MYEKNILIIILSIIIIGILSYIIYDKFYLSDSKSNVENKSIKQDLNKNNNNITKDEDTVEEIFNKFVKKYKLTIKNNVYDNNALEKIKCKSANFAVGNSYSLEMLIFDDNESAKEEYQSQNKYKLSTNKEKELLVSNSKDNYDIYEAILVPDLENAPAANGDEVDYVLYIRIDNYLLIFHQSSTDSNKNSYISLGSKLKEMLGIK